MFWRILSLFISAILSFSAEANRSFCGKDGVQKYTNQIQKDFASVLLTGSDPIVQKYRSEMATQANPRMAQNSFPREPWRSPSRPSNPWTASTTATPYVVVSGLHHAPLKDIIRHGNQIEEGAAFPEIEAIPKGCIQANLSRTIASEYYNCKTPKQAKVDAEDQPNCMTTEQVDYTHWLVNKVLNCMQSRDRPINAEIVFLKIGNETGFNINSCDLTVGCGLGQLMPGTVVQIGQSRNGFALDEDEKKRRPDNSIRTWQEFDISLNSRLNTDPNCVEFANLVKKENRVKSLTGGNRCEILAPGVGAATNLMYAISYFQYLKEDGREMDEIFHVLSKKSADESLSPQARVSWEDEDIKNYSALLRYNLPLDKAITKISEIINQSIITKRGDPMFGGIDMNVFKAKMRALDYLYSTFERVPRELNDYLSKQGSPSCRIAELPLPYDPGKVPVEKPFERVLPSLGPYRPATTGTRGTDQ